MYVNKWLQKCVAFIEMDTVCFTMSNCVIKLVPNGKICLTLISAGR